MLIGRQPQVSRTASVQNLVLMLLKSTENLLSASNTSQQSAKSPTILIGTRGVSKGTPHSGHPNHQSTVTWPKLDTFRGPPQSDVELMTQKEVLDFKPAP
jgi:hypothetical protein